LEADQKSPWIILGALPEKPMYVVPISGAGGVASTVAISGTVSSMELFSAGAPGPADLAEDATVFVGAAGGYETGSISKASAGRLYEAIATNALGTTSYFQLFNQTGLPTNGIIPVMSFPVAASATISISPRNGRYFSTGIVWGWSTNYSTFTGSSAGSAQVYTE
jgi:hypothetical protein